MRTYRPCREFPLHPETPVLRDVPTHWDPLSTRRDTVRTSYNPGSRPNNGTTTDGQGGDWDRLTEVVTDQSGPDAHPPPPRTPVRHVTGGR